MPGDNRLNEIIDCLYRVAAKAVIIQNGTILLVKEADEEWWSLPGGGIDHGEVPTEALRRELAEELGISADKIQVHDNILDAAPGGIVAGVPRFNIFYTVEIVGSQPVATTQILGLAWYHYDDLAGLSLSPSLKGFSPRLQKLLP